MYTILIVDDEKIERNGIKFLLKKQAEPFEIYEAPNGKAALEQLCSMRNQGKKIDILLTDVKMPFMDGIELIGAAKEEGFTLKTIIFSGYNEFEYAKQAVLLLNASPHYMTLQQTAQKLHDAVFKKYGEHCHFAISGEIDDYEKIPQTMDMLEALMENKFYRPDVYVYSEDISGETPVLVQIDDDTLMKQMKQDIKMKDIRALREHFDRMCAKYRKKSYFSQIYIKFIFSNLLKDFYQNLPETREEEFNKEIDTLYKSGDFNCIVSIVNSHIDKLEAVFAKNPQTQHKEIETVKKYIYTHFGDELGVEQLADMVYLAPSYLSTVFKKETGQNLSKFIKQYRMEKAKDMLENTNMKIVNISEACGYQNVSYFCQSFRECYGVSPQKFRNGI